MLFRPKPQRESSTQLNTIALKPSSKLQNKLNALKSFIKSRKMPARKRASPRKPKTPKTPKTIVEEPEPVSPVESDVPESVAEHEVVGENTDSEETRQSVKASRTSEQPRQSMKSEVESQEEIEKKSKLGPSIKPNSQRSQSSRTNTPSTSAFSEELDQQLQQEEDSAPAPQEMPTSSRSSSTLSRKKMSSSSRADERMEQRQSIDTSEEAENLRKSRRMSAITAESVPLFAPGESQRSTHANAHHFARRSTTSSTRSSATTNNSDEDSFENISDAPQTRFEGRKSYHAETTRNSSDNPQLRVRNSAPLFRSHVFSRSAQPTSSDRGNLSSRNPCPRPSNVREQTLLLMAKNMIIFSILQAWMTVLKFIPLAKNGIFFAVSKVWFILTTVVVMVRNYGTYVPMVREKMRTARRHLTRTRALLALTFLILLTIGYVYYRFFSCWSCQLESDELYEVEED